MVDLADPMLWNLLFNFIDMVLTILVFAVVVLIGTTVFWYMLKNKKLKLPAAKK